MNSTEIVIYKVLIDSVINHDELVLIKIEWKEYNNMKKKVIIINKYAWCNKRNIRIRVDWNWL